MNTDTTEIKDTTMNIKIIAKYILTLIFTLTAGITIATPLYSVDVNTDELVQIDSLTGAVAVIGSLGMDAQDIDLTLTDSGQLFGLNSVIGSHVDLWTIDLITGAVDTTIRLNGIAGAEGLGHSGNNLKIGYSSGFNLSFSDQFADLSTAGVISNSMSFIASNTGSLLDFDALSVGLGDIPFYAADVYHPISSSDTKLFTVDPDALFATAIGTYSTPSVYINDLVAIDSGLFMIDHINGVLHLANSTTGSLDSTISLNRNGYYLGLAAATSVPEPSTLILLGLGLAGIGYQRRRKQND
jgi:hypothetical protein